MTDKDKKHLTPARRAKAPANQKKTVKKKAPSKASKRAATRTHKIRQQLHNALRDKFKGSEYIRQLEDLAGELATLQKSTAVARKKKLTIKDKEKLLLIRAQLDTYAFELSIIKERINLNIRRLKFVLPELRSVEIQDTEGNNPLAVLGSALAQLTKSLSDT